MAIVVGGVGMLLGSILPWATVLGGLITVDGTTNGGDGWITFALGVLAVAAGIVLWRGDLDVAGLLGAALIGLAGLGTTVYDTGHFLSIQGVSVGGGLILALIASLVVLAGTVKVWLARADSPL